MYLRYFPYLSVSFFSLADLKSYRIFVRLFGYMASLLIWLLTRPVAFISWAAGGPRQAAAEAVAMAADQPALVAVADQLVDGHQQQQQRNPEFHTPPPPGRRYPGALDGVQLAPVGPAAGGPPAPVGQGFDQLRAYQLWMEVGAWDRYRYL